MNEVKSDKLILELEVSKSNTKLPKYSNVDVIEEDYDFSYALLGHVLEPLEKPCSDCAVVCGYYKEYSEILSKRDIAYQHEVSIRWDCHNDRRRACRGNIDMLKELNKDK